MQTQKAMDLVALEEIRILSDIRVLRRHDLNPTISVENLRVQFDFKGEIAGSITCTLCLDGHELNETEKQQLYPAFIEAMNILVGQQVSLDPALKFAKYTLSAPRVSLISQTLDSSLGSSVQAYALEHSGTRYDLLNHYDLTFFN